MAQDPAIITPTANPRSPEGDKPDVQPAGNQQAADDNYGPEPDVGYWLSCMEDAERAERDWRKRGREIVEIYRNEGKNSRYNRKTSAGIYFNILYSNTEVMLPAVYMRPPQPVVKARFANPEPPMPAQPPMPPMMPPGAPTAPQPGLPPPPPEAGPTPPSAPPAAALPPAPALPGAGGASPPIQLPDPAAAPVGTGQPPPGPPLAPGGGLMGPPAPMPPPAPPPDPMQMPLGPPPPDPKDVATAAAVIEKALMVVVDNEASHEAVKTAIKDTLLPGRGVCRVRWKPEMKTSPLPGGPLPDGTAPTEDKKVWETTDDEYVFWEDFLCDPVRQSTDTQWIAFRHLFAKEQLLSEFGNTPTISKLNAAGKLGDILKWTEEMAAKSPVGGGSAMRSAKTLGDHRKKAMIWEIWDRVNRRIIWMCRDASGFVLRVDPDVMQLSGFFPIPVPMLAVVTSDTRVPRAYYDLYDKLAEDLDNVSIRISKLTDQVKVRGAYNAASKDIADILTAGDGKMIGVDGVDLMSGGLQNHIWLVPVENFMSALDKLFLARDQLKQQIYEVMGISDIMRGATRASETATAQRIKGSMGMTRLEDLKEQAGNFVKDLLRLKAEVICQNFDASTLAVMTGEEVTPAVMAILRDDFQRACSVDIEADSTVQVDEQAEQQSMAMVMQSVQAVMQGAQQMLMTGILPPPQVIQLSLELLKMFLHPIRYSRGVVEMINQFQSQLQAMIMAPPPPPMLPPPGPGMGAGPPQGATGGPAGAAPGGRPMPKPAMPNGAPPVVPGGPPAPPMLNA